MTTYRIERLNKEFLRLIATLLQARIKNEAVCEAMLTNVDCSRDLSHAKVYFTVVDESRLPQVQEALEQSAGTVRGLLGKEMHIRHIPELRYIYDDSEVKARTMDALLDKIAQENAK